MILDEVHVAEKDQRQRDAWAGQIMQSLITADAKDRRILTDPDGPERFARAALDIAAAMVAERNCADHRARHWERIPYCERCDAKGVGAEAVAVSEIGRDCKPTSLCERHRQSTFGDALAVRRWRLSKIAGREGADTTTPAP